MHRQPDVLPRRSVGEWQVETTDQPYQNPFLDVKVAGTFYSPDGQTFNMPGFYDGDGIWRVRFNPGEAGSWTYRIAASPDNPELFDEGQFQVTANKTRGFLRTTPAEAWGFHYESGEPAFLLTDTTYNLFGAAYCGLDVRSYMERRKQQKFDFLRVRLHVSPFHPPQGYSRWQTRSTWSWGGSEQLPDLSRFNLDWFKTVDQVMEWAEEIDIGFEMIMEAWGFEFPFNNRNVFTAEWELLWLRYLIARYDAFNSVYFWTLMNEYEYYPHGVFAYDPVADHWAMRVGRWVKTAAPHDHIIAVHNGPKKPPFAQRFAADPHAVDCILFQEWGTTDQEMGWLAGGIEDSIRECLKDWAGSAMLVEYGYERNPDLPLAFPPFLYCDTHHTRRGAWRAACSGLCVGNGFENTWAPEQVLDQDQPGVEQLCLVKHFFTDVVSFAQLRPQPELVVSGDIRPGYRPLALAGLHGSQFVIYFPAGGSVGLKLLEPQAAAASWYDPRNGSIHPAQVVKTEANVTYFDAPIGNDSSNRPLDWVLFHR